MVMEELIERLRRARIGATFNFYRDGDGAAARRQRLRAYLEARENAPLLLVGEAAGHRGARVSGIPFTSERQLTRPRARPRRPRRSSVARSPSSGLEEETLCWNVVPTHPHLPGAAALEPAADAGRDRRRRAGSSTSSLAAAA